ncbi:MAG: sigma-70 family RNA polymerase sigma factor [Dehalococcoidia bacterium]
MLTPQAPSQPRTPSPRHLPAVEQARLAKAAQGGDRRAMEILITSNEGLFRRLVENSASIRRGADADDLMQEARLGFVRGVELFDPSHGVVLVTYAGLHAEAYIQRWGRNHARTIRVPIGAQLVQARAFKARARMGQSTPIEVIAEEIGESVERVQACDIGNCLGIVSLDHALVPGEGSKRDLTVADVTPEPGWEETFDRSNEAISLAKLAKRAGLSRREWYVVREMCLEGRGQFEIAKRMGGRSEGGRGKRGISRQRVGQIREGAVRKLRKAAGVHCAA